MLHSMRFIISYIKFCSCPLQFLKHRPIHLDMEKQASKKKKKKNTFDFDALDHSFSEVF